jgi:hypothetical protein
MSQVAHLLSEANSARQPLPREWIGGAFDSTHSRLLYNFADMTNQFNSTAIAPPNIGPNISLQQNGSYSVTNQNKDLTIRSSLAPQLGSSPVVLTAVGLTVGAVENRTGITPTEINITLPSQSGAIQAYPSYAAVGPSWFVWATSGGFSGNTAETNFGTISVAGGGTTIVNAAASNIGAFSVAGGGTTIVNAAASNIGAFSAHAPNVTVATNAASFLVERILAERRDANIDEESINAALAATDDALVLIKHNNLPGTPHIMYSNDGILTLQWECDEYGVALLFCGDHSVSIAFRRPGQLYAENGVEQPVTEKLLPRFYDALASTLGKSEKA